MQLTSKVVCICGNLMFFAGYVETTKRYKIKRYKCHFCEYEHTVFGGNAVEELINKVKSNGKLN